MTASFDGHVDIARMLIESKAQVNSQKEVFPPTNNEHIKKQIQHLIIFECMVSGFEINGRHVTNGDKFLL